MKNLDVPDTKDDYKVAQLYIGTNREPWIIGRSGSSRWYDFLADILTARNLPILWKRQKLEEKVQVPSLQGPNNEYTVTGIGTCIKIREVYYLFDSESLTYDNKKIDEEHLKEFQRLNPSFKYELNPTNTSEPSRSKPKILKWKRR